MGFSRFEEIIAWQKGQELAVRIYKRFGTLNDFGFRDQITRASVSISNNIAEGFERSSKADFARFLFIAKGSCAEVKSMLHLAQKLNYCEKEETIELIALSNDTSKLIRGLINSLN